MMYLYSCVWSDEDQVYVARVREFPSLSAHGDSKEAALDGLKTLVEFVVEEMLEEGGPVPEPYIREFCNE